eukprot:3913415-Rhodomonas_salina.3
MFPNDNVIFAHISSKKSSDSTDSSRFKALIAPVLCRRPWLCHHDVLACAMLWTCLVLLSVCEFCALADRRTRARAGQHREGPQHDQGVHRGGLQIQGQVSRSRCHRDLSKVRGLRLSAGPRPTLFKLQRTGTGTRALLSRAAKAGASRSLHSFNRQ